MPTLLKMLLGWLIFFLITWYGCVRPCCGTDVEAGLDETEQEEAAPDSVAATYPLETRYGLAAVTPGEGYEGLRERLTREAQSRDDLLEITGFYYEGEPAPEGFENMGLARAAAIADLLSPPLDRDRLQLRARLVGEGQEAPSADMALNAASLSWVAPPDPEDDPEDEVAVEELEDRIVITFPFRAATKDRVEPEIDDYLTRLAAQMQQDPAMRVQITGHTDNVSSEEFNRELGQRRADYLKGILVAKGVAADRITTRSRGESQPVASNETEAGRAENRRAELVILEE